MINSSNVVTNGRYLLDRRSRWLAFPPTFVLTSSGTPDSGYISCYLYGCSLNSCQFSMRTCNKCPYCLGFYSDILINNLLF